MAQIDARHAKKTLLTALLNAKHFPESIDLQIAMTRMQMDKSDIEDVMEAFAKEAEKHNLKIENI